MSILTVWGKCASALLQEFTSLASLLFPPKKSQLGNVTAYSRQAGSLTGENQDVKFH